MANKESSVVEQTVQAETPTEVLEAAPESVPGNEDTTTLAALPEGQPATSGSASKIRRTRGPALSLAEKRTKVDRWLTLRAKGGTTERIAPIVAISYPTFLKYQREITAIDAGQQEGRGRPTSISPTAPRATRSSDDYTIELDVRALVAANRQAVINALLVGKHEAIKKAVLDLIEG
ncbi:MAG: hypothetical protein ACYCZN_11710 [Candidatus Dormibacteria bacterium]